MAQRNVTELAAGAVVLVVAIVFLGYAVVHTGHGDVGGYSLHADFDHIDGLTVGSDVRMAGVKVGNVTATSVDPQSYQARVAFTVQNDIKLPTDSSAEITSDGLLGGKYLSVAPGGAEKMLADNGAITITQGSVSLEQLLGKFIFSVSDLATNVQKQMDTNKAKAGDAGGGLTPPLK
jgi:phospholipid/cholesterol/gamma-HCH transport system substrate-binding protein